MSSPDSCVLFKWFLKQRYLEMLSAKAITLPCSLVNAKVLKCCGNVVKSFSQCHATEMILIARSSLSSS